MEVQIKKTIRAGNSSAVVLPRAWLNKDVRVELVKKTHETILKDVLEILKKYISLNSIIGIYLTGSYARGEEGEGSDIDILVITDNIDREMIYEGIYNILIVSYQLFYQKLKRDLLPIGQMIKEAKPLLNRDYISDLKIKVTNKNIKWYLDTTKEKLEIIKEYIDDAKKIEKIRKNKIKRIKKAEKIKNRHNKYLRDKIAYTLILRIRTLEIIKKLIQNKNYSKKEFIRLIKKISGRNNAYERYLASKNKLKEENRLGIDEAQKLYNYLKKDLKKVKEMV